MTERFVATDGTITVANGSSTVFGTGTLFGGRDREAAQIWAHPTNAAPYRIGTVAGVDPRGVYDNLQLPLLHPWNGPSLAAQPYELIDGDAIANGATQAAIYARFSAFLEQNMGLVGNTADSINYALVPENTLFVDGVTRSLFQWRAGVLNVVSVVGIAWTPRGLWSAASTYAINDLVQFGAGAFVSITAGNINHQPTISPSPASSAFWTLLPTVAGPAGTPGGNIYDLLLFDAGRPAAAEELWAVPASRAIVYPASFAGSLARCEVAPTSPVVVSIRRNGIEVGTVSFAAAATSGVFAGGGITYAIGQILSIVAPNPRDANFAGLMLNIQGTR